MDTQLHAPGRAAPFLLLLFIQLISAVTYGQNTKLILQPGANFLVTGGTLVLNKTDLQTDGLLDAGNATLLITGAGNTSYAGAVPLAAGSITLNTAALSVFTMNNTLKLSGALNFQNGLIDLNGQQLQITGSGLLQGESETSRLTGISGGSILASATGINNPFQFNTANLGAALTTTANLGNLSVSRFGKPATNPGNVSLHGIQRTFLIQPQNNVALDATLRFYYLNAELNGDDPNTLTLWKSSNGIAWQQVGADSRNTIAKYVEKSGIADFSYWTLTDALNALPLSLVSFSAHCAAGYTQLQWQTGVESGIDHFEIERSTGSAAWTRLGEIPCANNSTGSSYSFRDKDALASAVYRLKIINQQGTFSYSPVFKGGCADIAMPFMVYPNPATAAAFAQLSVREAATATIKLVDNAGKLLYSHQWKLQPGMNLHPLPVTALAAGTYFIQTELNNAILQTTLVKQ